jgi:hypothetical protein
MAELAADPAKYPCFDVNPKDRLGLATCRVCKIL